MQSKNKMNGLFGIAEVIIDKFYFWIIIIVTHTTEQNSSPKIPFVNKFPLLPLILHSRNPRVSFIPHLHPKIYYERVYRSKIFYFQYHFAALCSQNNGWRDPLLSCQLLWELAIQFVTWCWTILKPYLI